VTTPAEPLLHTVAEAAELLQISARTLEGLIARGDIASFRIGRLRRIPHTALADFIGKSLAEQAEFEPAEALRIIRRVGRTG